MTQQLSQTGGAWVSTHKHLHHDILSVRKYTLEEESINGSKF